MSDFAAQLDDPVDRRLVDLRRTMANDLAATLDLETRLREAMIPARHADFVADLRDVLDVEAELSAIAPATPDGSSEADPDEALLIPDSTGRAVVANLALVVDEDVLRRARLRALRQGTSVDALVREYLVRVAGESEARRGMDEFFASVTGAGGGSGGRTWTRDELHDRA
ncbi:MAG: hypothetical protein ACRDTG_18705 [Pseudonocardiaceae bacterium]